MKLHSLTSLLLSSATLAWAVPSEINYQGRLTDANGDAVTGDVTMSLKMFDAATEGNEIYSEDIGTVTLDSNGIYSFEFGASGQSVIDRTDTIAVADGTATTFTGSISSTPLNGTLSVSDGTYSWNIVDGNPGQQATATAQLVNGFVVGITVSNGGEGYTEAPVVTINGNGTAATATAVVENGVLTAINADTTGSGYTNATVSIAPPPAPYVVYYSAGTVTVTYESAPIERTEIVASYEANDSSIVGALSAADSHWLELSVNASAQSPRERVLSVPFAQVAGVAKQVNQTELDRSGYVKHTPVIQSGYLSAYGKPVIESDVEAGRGGTFNFQFSDQIQVSEGQKIVFKNFIGDNSTYQYGGGNNYTIYNNLLIKKPSSTPSDVNRADILYDERLLSGSNLSWDVEFYGPIDVQLERRVISSATSRDFSQFGFARVGYAIVEATPVIQSGYLSAYGKPVIESDVEAGRGGTFNFQFSDQIQVSEGQKIVFKNFIGDNSTYQYGGGNNYTIYNNLLIKKPSSTPSDVNRADILYDERLLSGSNLSWDVEFYGPIDVQLERRVISSATSRDFSQFGFARVGYAIVEANSE